MRCSVETIGSRRDSFTLGREGGCTAQYNLGLLYASGLGVAQDYQAALKWHRMAATQGHAGAQNELAQMYAKGQGVQPDQVLAYVWYTVAIESSSGGSKNEITKDRDRTASRMTPEQISEGARAGAAVPRVEVQEVRRQVRLASELESRLQRAAPYPTVVRAAQSVSSLHNRRINSLAEFHPRRHDGSPGNASSLKLAVKFIMPKHAVGSHQWTFIFVEI